MSEAKEKSVPKPVKQDILDMAATIKKAITVDHKAGTFTATSEIYESLLPEGLNKETVATLSKFNTQFAAAATLAVGEAAIPLMKKNKDVTRIEGSFPLVGKDTFDVTFNRSSQVPNRTPNGIEGTKEKFGTLRNGFTIYGTGDNGEMKRVKAQLADQALAAFGS